MYPLSYISIFKLPREHVYNNNNDDNSEQAFILVLLLSADAAVGAVSLLRSRPYISVVTILGHYNRAG